MTISSLYSSERRPLIVGIDVTGHFKRRHGLLAKYVRRGQCVHMLHARRRHVPEMYCAVFMTENTRQQNNNNSNSNRVWFHTT